MKKNKKQIKCSQDLNDIISDMFEDFLFDFRDRKGLTYDACGERPLVEYEEGIQWYYTQKAMILIERWKLRMEKVFKKYFPDEEFNPVTTYYKEF
jgi:hypothetical protein